MFVFSLSDLARLAARAVQNLLVCPTPSAGATGVCSTPDLLPRCRGPSSSRLSSKHFTHIPSSHSLWPKDGPQHHTGLRYSKNTESSSRDTGGVGTARDDREWGRDETSCCKSPPGTCHLCPGLLSPLCPTTHIPGKMCHPPAHLSSALPGPSFYRAHTHHEVEAALGLHQHIQL